MQKSHLEVDSWPMIAQKHTAPEHGNNPTEQENGSSQPQQWMLLQQVGKCSEFEGNATVQDENSSEQEVKFPERESKMSQQEMMCSAQQEQQGTSSERAMMFSQHEDKASVQDVISSGQENKFSELNVILSKEENKLSVFTEQTPSFSDRINYSMKHLDDEPSIPGSDTKPPIFYMDHMDHVKLEKDHDELMTTKPSTTHYATEIKAEPPDIDDPATTYNHVSDSVLSRCLTCPYATPSARALNDHIRDTHITFPGHRKCTRCGRLAKHPDLPTQHCSISLRGSEVFGCALCPYASSYVGRYTIHMMRKHTVDDQDDDTEPLQPDLPFVCRPCRHGGHAEQTTESFGCGQCDYATRWRGCLIAHQIRMHARPRHSRRDGDGAETPRGRHKCPHCDYRTARNDRMRIHASKHGGEARTYRCPHCDYTTKWKQNVAAHVRGLHAGAPVSFACDLCPYTSRFQAHFGRHVRKAHRSWRCDLCDYTTRLRGELAAHGRARHGHECSHCGLTLKSKDVLANHVRVKHDPAAQVYRCAECEYTTKIKFRLKEHVTARHDVQARLYKCAHCDYTGKMRRNLYRHAKVHEQGARFVCARCEYSGGSRRELVAHFRTEHG